MAAPAPWPKEPAGLPALDRQVDEAFRQVLKTPASLDAGLKYARLLVAAGNYEGGVAALERLLLSPNPQPGIRVELAVLYYRLGRMKWQKACCVRHWTTPGWKASRARWRKPCCAMSVHATSPRNCAAC